MSSDVWLVLIASLVATRLVVQLLRGAWADQRPYLMLLGVDLGLIALARGLGGGALGFVAACAGLVLALAPGLLDTLEASTLRRGGARAARRIALLREALVPGKAATRQRRALDQRAAVGAGDTGRAIEALEAELAKADDPELVRQLHTELVLIKLIAGRTDEAIAHAARQLDTAAYERSPVLTAAMSTALSERGRLHEAVQLLALLEVQASGRDLSAQPLLGAARLSFLAGAGLVEELDRLLRQPGVSESISADDAARLRAVAGTAEAPDPELRMVAFEIARRMLELSERAAVPIGRRAPATLAIIAVNLVATGITTWLGLGGEELGVARAGALWGPAVQLGQWWRLLSATFLHAGPLHLGANMYGLYLLGRATEELIGSGRLVVVYAVAGLGGALASLWADRGLSVGASGAIMGLLAALTAIVFSRRRAFHPAALRVLLGNLLFLGALQAYIGWQVPMIDNAAHAGGFVAGLMATLGLAPGGELGRTGRALVRIAAAAYVIACGIAAFEAVRTPLDSTLLALPTKSVDVDGVRAQVPRSWRREDTGLLVDPYLGIELHLKLEGDTIQLRSPQANDSHVRPLLERISSGARPASQAP